jgi:hypothetical protein
MQLSIEHRELILSQMRQPRRYPVPHLIDPRVQPPDNVGVDLVDLSRRHKFGKPLNFGDAFPDRPDANCA